MTPIAPDKAKRYPANWEELRAAVLQRAGNACEWCGAKNGEPHPRTGSKVVLTVAHVYDHRPEEASLDNLAALCQKDHNRHDSTRRRKRLPLDPPGPQPRQRRLG